MSLCFDDLPLFRNTDPDTSRQVSTSSLSKQCMVFLSFYGQSSIGLTDEQAAVNAGEAGHNVNGYWKRCSDLRRLGLIEDIGVRRELSSGKRGMVCVITAAGREALA